MSKYTIALHGGAGTILRQDMTPEMERQYLSGLEAALDAGFSMLKKGAKALEAVVATVKILEDNILFNAGRGSVFTNAGRQEMDAAVMDGNTLAAGAVAAVRNIKNPIALALQVMQSSNHVFLSGEGAFDFAIQQGMKTEPDEYFFSEFRYDQWKALRNTDEYALDHSSDDEGKIISDKKFGTVGAVACDESGDIAAATSTGGMTNKKYGRIGDTPIIGAGTYANNRTCAISCTGHGEPFIRGVAAYDVSCLMEYRGLGLHDAMQVVVNDRLIKLKGEGGMIGVDGQGNAAMIFNSDGMYRAMCDSEGAREIAIYR